MLTRAYIYKIPSLLLLFLNLNSLFVWLLVCCGCAVRCVRVRVCAYVRLLSVGVDFHSIVTLRRLEFNLNEMWQMGKNCRICTRESPMSECGGSAAQIDTLFLSLFLSLSLLGISYSCCKYCLCYYRCRYRFFVGY